MNAHIKTPKKFQQEQQADIAEEEDDAEQEEALLKPSQIKAKIQQAQAEHGLHPSLFENMDEFNQDASRRRGRLQSIPPRPKLPAGYQKRSSDESPGDRSPHQRQSSFEENQSPVNEEYTSEPMTRRSKPTMQPEIIELPETNEEEESPPRMESYDQEPGSRRRLDAPPLQTEQQQPVPEQKSFGPEDEEVAEIIASADAKRSARKEKRRKKKEMEAQAAAEQALLAAQQQHAHPKG